MLGPPRAPRLRRRSPAVPGTRSRQQLSWESDHLCVVRQRDARGRLRRPRLERASVDEQCGLDGRQRSCAYHQPPPFARAALRVDAVDACQPFGPGGVVVDDDEVIVSSRVKLALEPSALLGLGRGTWDCRNCPPSARNRDDERSVGWPRRAAARKRCPRSSMSCRKMTSQYRGDSTMANRGRRTPPREPHVVGVLVREYDLDVLQGIHCSVSSRRNSPPAATSTCSMRATIERTSASECFPFGAHCSVPARRRARRLLPTRASRRWTSSGTHTDPWSASVPVPRYPASQSRAGALRGPRAIVEADGGRSRARAS
jgi:hypothetical protein